MASHQSPSLRVKALSHASAAPFCFRWITIACNFVQWESGGWYHRSCRHGGNGS